MKQNKNAKNKDEIKAIVDDILDQFHNNDWREAPEQDRNWEVKKK